MRNNGFWMTALAIIVGMPACTTQKARQSPPVMVMPVTTSSDEAREEFMSGLYAYDMGRFRDARGYFENAVEQDNEFALAYLYLAFSSTSLENAVGNLEKAGNAALKASREEQLLVEITQRSFDNDIEGQLVTANMLIESAPESPRAYLALAQVQSGMNQHLEARQSIDRAIELAPSMAAAHMQACNSYLFSEPRDLDQAEQHIQKAIELAPNEPSPYDLLGDVYRMQGKLEKARDAYTEASKYSGDDGSPFQQRGHVNSFLGDFDAARADYDRAIEMGRDNQAPGFRVYKALIHVHAGDPSTAIDELKRLVAEIDEMDVPEPTGSKIFALSSAINIALHHDMIGVAEELIADWTSLMRIQSRTVGSDAFNRNQEAAIAYIEGMLAVDKGEFGLADEKVNQIAMLVEPDANPRKMEPMHELLGAIALEQGRFREAAQHFQQGDHENDIYITYHLAKALEAAGETDPALKLYEKVASWNFNAVGLALTRKEAIQKVRELSGMAGG